MLECQYASEPVDLRLLGLRLWKRAGRVLFITLLGALLFGGGYCLKEFVFTPGRYVAVSLYQVEYALDPVVGNEYTYINGNTWDAWMDTQEFLDLFYENLEGTQDAAIDRGTMKEYLSARLPMDLRMPETRVSTSDPELSLRLAAALERTMEDFAGVQKGIDNIRVVDPAKEAPYYTEARPLNAFVLGGAVTLFVTLTILCIKELGDDGVWLPITLEKRYGLKALGTVESAEFGENARYLIGRRLAERQGTGKIGVLPVGGEQVPKEALEALEAALREGRPREELCLEAFPCAERHPQIAERLRGMDALVLAVEAGSHMGRALEATLQFLALQDCPVTAALLTHADERLIRRYDWRERLFGGRGGRSGE